MTPMMIIATIVSVIVYLLIGLFTAANFAWCFGVSHGGYRPWWSPFLIPAIIIGYPIFAICFLFYLIKGE